MGRAIREALNDVVARGHTALLVIDVQNDFCYQDCQAMLPRLERLIAVAREAGVFVVYIQNVILADGSSNSLADLARRQKIGIRSDLTVEGTWGGRIVDQIAPRPSEPVIRKHRMSSFVGTSLDLLLRNRGIETVVCTGTATQGCVINTAYTAVMLDYYVVVVDDCVASFRRDLHDTALFLMKNSIHQVVDSGALIDIWSE